MICRYVYVGDRAARALGSPWLGQVCEREPGWPWRVQALVRMPGGRLVAAYWRCLRRVRDQDHGR